MYTVYILKTSKDTLYTGITNNLQRRIKEHQNEQPRGRADGVSEEHDLG